QGIGRAIAVAFGERGDTVALAARSRDRLEQTAAQVSSAGGEPLIVETDVADLASVEAMVRTVLDAHSRIDVVVNNSGIGGPSGR
ncbi:MAG: SDR family NAD(P)-dependent oxidoreductase, partial [Actinobacteria bacterium]|nr:SDR family NAD(P)-dependent oxidoreductase [Actinomycetota bacterium]